jgi:hypothetical protein
VDFTLRDTSQTKSDIGADIVSQGIQQEQRLAESGPKVEEFLPDYEKALTGDQDAIMRTGYRLQNPYEERKVEDIRPTAGQTFLDFLRAPGQDTYHTELAKQQGGPFGVNALDAARLAASGQGARAFSRAAQDIGSVYNLIPEAEARVAESETRRANQYAETVDSIRALLQGGERELKTAGEREIEAYRTRDLGPELRALVEELKVTNPEISPYIGEGLGAGFEKLNPFIDRELTFAETLSPEEADRYNIIAELLGVNPVQRLAPEAGFNRDSVIAAILAAAQNEQTTAETERKRQESLTPEQWLNENARGLNQYIKSQISDMTPAQQAEILRDIQQEMKNNPEAQRMGQAWVSNRIEEKRAAILTRDQLAQNLDFTSGPNRIPHISVVNL